MTTTEDLQGGYLFKPLHDYELQMIIDACHEQQLSAGTVVFEQDSQADAIYIVLEGSIALSQIINGQHIAIATLSTGAHFGEMAFIDSSHRSATATCATDARLNVLTFDALNSVLAQDLHIATKLYCAFAHFLAARLRATTHELALTKELLEQPPKEQDES